MNNKTEPVRSYERTLRNEHAGSVVWLTGLSAAGKTTIASALERELFNQGRQVYVLDGDKMRQGLCSDLDFSPGSRKENIRRAGEMAKMFADAGIICITAFISPYRSDRDMVRAMIPPGGFLEVFINAPLTVCEQRDPKGLYAKARAGVIKDFTGISAPYEPPMKPELELRTDQLDVTACVAAVLLELQKRANHPGQISARAESLRA
jgi:adenylyl-sulfate kinase